MPQNSAAFNIANLSGDDLAALAGQFLAMAAQKGADPASLAASRKAASEAEKAAKVAAANDPAGMGYVKSMPYTNKAGQTSRQLVVGFQRTNDDKGTVLMTKSRNVARALLAMLEASDTDRRRLAGAVRRHLGLQDAADLTANAYAKLPVPKGVPHRSDHLPTELETPEAELAELRAPTI